MPVREKIFEITTTLNPGFMVGNVVEVAGRPLIVVGIRHTIAGFATSTVEVAEPRWSWRAKYRLTQWWKRAVRFFVTAWRRLRS